jgi:hypothetical protein
MRIFGCKKGESDWRRIKLYNEELHNLYPTPNIKVIKLRGMNEIGEMHVNFYLNTCREGST